MNTTTTPNTRTAADRVVVGLTHGPDHAEDVLIAYLMGVEAIRAGKEAVLWLTKDAIEVAIDGTAETIDVPGAPSIEALHTEFVEGGGRFFACPVCVKLRDRTDAVWAKGVEVVGAPSVYEFAGDGALVFNY